jgi:hypothetical protein
MSAVLLGKRALGAHVANLMRHLTVARQRFSNG